MASSFDSGRTFVLLVVFSSLGLLLLNARVQANSFQVFEDGGSESPSHSSDDGSEAGEKPYCQWNNTKVELKASSSVTGVVFRCNISEAFTVYASGVDTQPGLTWLIELYNTNDSVSWLKVIGQTIVDADGFWDYKSLNFAPIVLRPGGVEVVLSRSSTVNTTVDYKSLVNVRIEGQTTFYFSKSRWWLGLVIGIPVGLVVGFLIYLYQKRRNSHEII